MFRTTNYIVFKMPIRNGKYLIGVLFVINIRKQVFLLVIVPKSLTVK